VPLPQAFVEHLRTEGYNPRSNKHSNALSEAIVADLIENCPSLAAQAAVGRLVYSLNFDLIYGQSQWNVDLVLGAPPPGTPPPEDTPIRRSDPATVQVAVELKSVMTEHRKAVKNRKRDFEAHHDHVHRYSAGAIAGAVMVVNAAPTFKSPLRPDVTVHKNPPGLVEHCFREMRNISMRLGEAGHGLDAAAILVVNMDNTNLPESAYVAAPPAPAVGDPLHYDAFVQRLCAAYTRRF
jgi:hypothetical protein